MGLGLSILFSYVGAVELALVVRDVTHQVCLHNEQLNDATGDQKMERLQADLRSSIRQASRAEIAADEHLMQDGVAYDNGYRVEEQSRADRAAADRWQRRRKELSSGSDDDDAKQQRSERKCTAKSFADGKYLTAKRSEETISPQSSMSVDAPEIHFDEYERTEPSGKNRPIVRDDGSGRRRAFKKRQQQSSASSTSSGEPNRRLSREEELRMFTSLEEEEFEQMRRSDYAPMQYSGESTLKARKQRQHRQRRSSGPDEANVSDEGDVGDAENSDPWGDVRPKHVHDSELWRKERDTSIVEEHEETEESHHSHHHHHHHAGAHQVKRSPQITAVLQSSTTGGKQAQRSGYSPVSDRSPQLATFAEATDNEHEIVIDAMKRRHTAKHDVSICECVLR